MAKASKSRFVVALCVLLLLQEFGQARTALEPPKKLISTLNEEGDENDLGDEEQTSGVNENENSQEYTAEGSAEEEETKEDRAGSNAETDLVPQEPSVQSAGKKGFASLIFKGIKISGTVTNLVTSAIALSTAIYKAIHGCCGKLEFPEACDYKKQFEAVRKDVERLSKVADKLQAEAEHEQTWVKSTLDSFNSILVRLKKIDDVLKKTILDISPEVSVAMKDADDAIEKIIKQKNATVGSTYSSLVSMYNSKIDNALNILYPTLAIALPVGINLFKFARKRFPSRRVMDISGLNNVDLDLPDGASSEGKRARISEMYTKFKTQVSNVKENLKLKYEKAFKIAKVFKKVLVQALGFASAGFQIFEIIKQRNGCRDMRDAALKAKNNVTEARKLITNNIAEIRKHGKVMKEAWTYVRGNMTGNVFLGSLGEVRKMLGDLGSRSAEMKTVADTVFNFINTIKTSKDFQGTFSLSNNLLTQLYKVPFTVSCYNSKYDMIKRMFAGCKEGKKSFDTLYIKEQNSFVAGSPFDPDNPSNCETKVGFKYIRKQDVWAAWKNESKRVKMNKICLMNYQLRVGLVKYWKKQWYEAPWIAKKLNISQADAQTILDNTPLIEKQMKVVCERRKKNMTNQQIAAKHHWVRRFVRRVTCPRPLEGSEKRLVCRFRKKGWSNQKIATKLSLNQQLVTKVVCP